MLLIRLFLWLLVAFMCFHGYMHADEYGSEVTLFGGMGLTMSIWKESLSEGTRSLFWTAPQFVPLPRAVVRAALEETARHPGLHVLPPLQRALRKHRDTRALFRDASVEWMLGHAELVGGFVSEPEALEVWDGWVSKANESATLLEKAKARVCSVRLMQEAACGVIDQEVARLEAVATADARGRDAWASVVRIETDWSVAAWWSATQRSSLNLSAFEARLGLLHDVSDPWDGRLESLKELAVETAEAASTNRWLTRITTSLLIGELWDACLHHVRRREFRVRDMMVRAGVQELWTAHERALNASVKGLSAADTKVVQDWFGEMMGYAWWLGDDLLPVVRRCLGQQHGDCIRVGPTEITALSAQLMERSKIVEDFARRVFIGMWNGLPAVALVFLVELLIVCMPKRVPLVSYSTPLTLPPPSEQAPQLDYYNRRPMITLGPRRLALKNQ
jgi:hypothetical protein